MLVTDQNHYLIRLYRNVIYLRPLPNIRYKGFCWLRMFYVIVLGQQTVGLDVLKRQYIATRPRNYEKSEYLNINNA
jgi:hypothetical protein